MTMQLSHPRILPNRRRRAWRGASAVLALATLLMTWTLTVAQESATGTATPGADDASYLFVQAFSSGTWQPSDEQDGVFLLTLNGVGAETIYFTDRPVHQVGLVPTGEFLDAFGFTPDDPPNAALAVRTETGDLEIMVIELLHPTYDKASGTMTYESVLLEEYDEAALAGLAERASGTMLPASFGSGQLFIDSSKCDPGDWEHCIII